MSPRSLVRVICCNKRGSVGLSKRQRFSVVYLKAALCLYRKALNLAAAFLSLPPVFLRAGTGSCPVQEPVHGQEAFGSWSGQGWVKFHFDGINACSLLTAIGLFNLCRAFDCFMGFDNKAVQ